MNQLNWVTNLKAIGIVAVILGHLNSPFGGFIFSWHMPLFFMLAGFFIKFELSFKESITKDFRRLMIPYFIFALLGLLIESIKRSVLHRESLEYLYELKSIFVWMDMPSLIHTYAFVLWFLPALFFARISFVVINKYIKNLVLQFLIVLLLFYISFRVDLPFGIDNAFNALLFLFIGNLFFRYYQENRILYSLPLISLVIYLAFGIPSLDMATKNYSNILLNSMFAFGVIYALVLCLKKFNFASKISSEWGGNTMLLFIVHPYTNNIAHIIAEKIHFGSWSLKFIISILLLQFVLYLKQNLKIVGYLSMYDYVIITHIPAFYKVNLYNELAKKINIYVIFVAANTREKRAEDFVVLEEIKFKYDILFDGNFQDRNTQMTLQKLRNTLKTVHFKKVIVSGWDLKEFWYIVFFNRKFKNCLALESTVLESNVKGIKRIVKQLFLSRISIVFASGSLHVKLLDELYYKESIKITKGVGIINKPIFQKNRPIYQKRFLYVGRLSYVKNLKFLIEIFNALPEYTLTLIGEGEDKDSLKNIAKENIVFLSSMPNRLLKEKFLENDILILPSIMETWGLVVEEALYFGLPVIVSQNCGSCELVENGLNGYVIDPCDTMRLKDIILTIDAKQYAHLLEGVKNFSIDSKDKIQVESYL